ncbi:hypothetical protein AK95_29015 [Paenibacillus sp. LC231]|nr:hypothetical protein AK95_29015 [Paenibacillus sp. LC231]
MYRAFDAGSSLQFKAFKRGISIIARGKMAIILALSLCLLVTCCRAETGERTNQLNAKSNIKVNQTAKPVWI